MGSAAVQNALDGAYKGTVASRQVDVNHMDQKRASVPQFLLLARRRKCAYLAEIVSLA